jgi:hypothetical protein
MILDNRDGRAYIVERKGAVMRDAKSQPSTAGALDLVNEIRRVLRESDEPLTAAKVHQRLPVPLRRITVEALVEVLQRQAAANVLVMCPKYRSGQDRYWDRPLREHVHEMLHAILTAGPLPWAEMRRRLPRYARYLAESVLNEQLAHGRLHRHPPRTSRAAPRYGLEPADVRAYLQPALADVFARLEPLGFTPGELRRGLRQLLGEGGWSAEPVPSYTYAETDAAASLVDL